MTPKAGLCADHERALSVVATARGAGWRPWTMLPPLLVLNKSIFHHSA